MLGRFGAPAELAWHVQEVAGQARRHQEADRAISRRDSFRLAHVIEQRLSKGGSGQGYGPGAKQALTLTGPDSVSEYPVPPQVGLWRQTAKPYK